LLYLALTLLGFNSLNSTNGTVRRRAFLQACWCGQA
jgi:hypothetical protein